MFIPATRPANPTIVPSMLSPVRGKAALALPFAELWEGKDAEELEEPLDEGDELACVVGRGGGPGAGPTIVGEGIIGGGSEDGVTTGGAGGDEEGTGAGGDGEGLGVCGAGATVGWLVTPPPDWPCGKPLGQSLEPDEKEPSAGK